MNILHRCQNPCLILAAQVRVFDRLSDGQLTCNFIVVDSTSVTQASHSWCTDSRKTRFIRERLINWSARTQPPRLNASRRRRLPVPLIRVILTIIDCFRSIKSASSLLNLSSSIFTTLGPGQAIGLSCVCVCVCVRTISFALNGILCCCASAS